MDLITTNENQANACQTGGLDLFSHDNISACEKYVLSIQRRLDKAVANDDETKIRWYAHLLMKRTRAVKILAVNRICKVNDGRHTAGVDGQAIPRTPDGRHAMMMELLNDIDIDGEPQPIKRVFIPKPNGDKRPLGIPTLKDRINQEIIRQTIEPICEYHFQTCSYGFRPKRSCHDAMSDLFNKLSRANSKRWIVEGDIKGCFDNIEHDHIISTLNQWKVPTNITTLIKGFLKAKIMEESLTIYADKGTPQGGVISPLLANVALTSLDNEMRKRFGSDEYNPMVRYADDFVIIAKSKTEAENIKSHVKDFLSERIGLTLSDEKTHITEISRGFDFLGFNVRKYGKQDKLLITPSKESIKRAKGKIKHIFNHTDKLDILIRKLTRFNTGWCNYYRHVVSKATFKNIDNYIWILTKRWIKKRHPRQRARYWVGKYFTKVKGDRWTLYDSATDLTLNRLEWIAIKRFIKVRKDVRVYDVNAKEYWDKRESLNAQDALIGSGYFYKLYQAQKGRCAYCKHPFTEQQVKESSIHKHHLIPRSKGGDSKGLHNLRLLHVDCHNTLHQNLSREKMADLIEKGIDYLRLLKPAKR